MISGPCVMCGGRDYPLSMGGTSICPTCDTGVSSDPREYRRLREENASLQSEVTRLTQALAQATAVEMRIRTYLWLGHGHKGVYGDDGEMQCGECLPFGAYDYKREPLDKLMDVLDRWSEHRMHHALTASEDLS